MIHRRTYRPFSTSPHTSRVRSRLHTSIATEPCRPTACVCAGSFTVVGIPHSSFLIPHSRLDVHLLRKGTRHRNRLFCYLASLGFFLFAQPTPNEFGLAFAHSSVWLKVLQQQSAFLDHHQYYETQIPVPLQRVRAERGGVVRQRHPMHLQL